MEGAPALFGLDMEPDIRGVDDNEDPELIRRRLESMPPYVLEVFLRITVDRQSVPEVALHLGLSQRGVRRLLRRAIAILDGRD
ncbi:sigma-70 region 4 domain-containing protein [Sphingomonas oryzagri]